MEPIGLYLHIPFCKQRCPYCDFYTKVTEEDQKDGYVTAVLSAMENHPFGDLQADTFYLGGGTPTVLGAQRLKKLTQKAKEIFHIQPDAEITLEANPESTTLELLEQLREVGFNRVSFGVQSANEKELKALGRIHSAEQAEHAIYMAEKAGFPHISADLMLNIPYQTRESLTHSIDFMTNLPLDHISAYMLIIEEGTPFATQHIEKLCPPESEEAENYLFLVNRLEQAGFAQYEISNFAKPMGKSLHNLKYWESKPYLGIGPSAHSYLEKKRFSTPSDLAAYLETTGDWSYVHQDGEGGDWEEYAMLRLRLSPGLSLQELELRYPQADVAGLRQRAERFLSQKVLTLTEDVITYTPKGFLLSDYLTGELLFG